VEERWGTACEEDTTAGSEVPLITGFTPRFAASACGLGASEAGVESVGVVFPCNEYGFDIEVAGRFCIKASVDGVALPTDLCGAVDSAVAEGTFLGTEKGDGPVDLETENATRESGRF